MNKETKTKYSVSIMCSLIGLFLCLEGMEITHLSENKNNAPGEILILTGVIFILASVMVHAGKKEKLNNFLASILTSIMGLIFAWVGLFGGSSGFSDNGTLLSMITDLPLDRIMFGFGSLLCFLISAIAFSMFLKSKSENKYFKRTN